MPIDHAKLPVSDLEASRTFYSAALAPLGWKLVWDEAPTLGFGRGDGGEDDEPLAFQLADAPISTTHLALTAESTEQVDAFHEAALAAGGQDNGPPGIRRVYHEYYYGAYVLDLEGNNIEAVTHTPE
jgi:catechol 2,3-dioxygenase-like lactoylglutathione lyase family enzyme